MACLQIHRELLLHATFLRVHSNSEEAYYLFWQNTYHNLSSTCHIKLELFLWTKLLENLLLAKYLISSIAPLTFTYNGYTLYQDATVKKTLNWLTGSSGLETWNKKITRALPCITCNDSLILLSFRCVAMVSFFTHFIYVLLAQSV